MLWAFLAARVVAQLRPPACVIEARRRASVLLSNGRRLVVALRRTHPELVQCEGEPGGPILASLLQTVHTSSRD
jgi:hypothetical protein